MKSSHRLVGLLWLVAAAPVMAQEAPPEEVYVGTYLNQIFDVSLKDNKFCADFYIWFRWKSDAIDPFESFEVVNGRVESKTGEYTDEIEGYHYASCRVIATISKFWDITRFPLDNHTLTIEIEDTDNEEFKLRYLSDVENCGFNPGVRVPGWEVDRMGVSVVPHTYTTNYGDISLPTNAQSIYSRFIFALDIIRPGYGYFIKSFFTVFVAALVALVALFIKPIDLDPRFGLGAGALFAAVASEVVIASMLPDTSIITLADRLHIIAITFVFLSIAESIVALRLYEKGQETQSHRLDRISFYVCLVLFLGLVGLSIFV